MQLQTLYKLLCVAATFFFCAISVFLSYWDYNLHHDGFVLTQSLRILNGEAPYREVFIQYGVLFHIIYGFVFKLTGSFHLLKLTGVFLSMFIGLILWRTERKQFPLSAPLAVTIWFATCYWLFPYNQYFPQLHPSQLALLCFVVAYAIVVNYVGRKTVDMRVLLCLSLLILAALNIKLNFGILLFGVVLVSLCVVTASLRHVGFFLLPLGVFSLAALGYFYLLSVDFYELILRIHLRFAGDLVSVTQFIKSLVYLDTGHGGVTKIQRTFFLAPLAIILYWLIEGGLRKLTLRKDDLEDAYLATDQRLVILSIFSLGVWVTVFPVGAYQHIWYASLFPILAILQVLSKTWRVIPGKFRGLGTIVCFMAFFNFFLLEPLGRAYSKIVHLDSFQTVELGSIGSINAHRSVVKVLTSVEALTTGEDCGVLNLSNIAFPNQTGICGAYGGRKHFTWPSDWSQKFADFHSLLQIWRDRPVLAHTEILSYSHNVAVDVRGIPQDFTNRFLIYKGILPISDNLTGQNEPIIGENIGNNEYLLKHIGATQSDPVKHSRLLVGPRPYFVSNCDLVQEIVNDENNPTGNMEFLAGGASGQWLSKCMLTLKVSTEKNYHEFIAALTMLDMKYGVRPSNFIEVPSLTNSLRTVVKYNKRTDGNSELRSGTLVQVGDIVTLSKVHFHGQQARLLD